MGWINSATLVVAILGLVIAWLERKDKSLKCVLACIVAIIAFVATAGGVYVDWREVPRRPVY